MCIRFFRIFPSFPVRVNADRQKREKVGFAPSYQPNQPRPVEGSIGWRKAAFGGASSKERGSKRVEEKKRRKKRQWRERQL